MHSSSFLPVFRSAHHDALLLLEFVLRAVLLRLNGVEHLLLLLRRNAGRNGLRLSLLIAFLLLNIRTQEEQGIQRARLSLTLAGLQETIEGDLALGLDLPDHRAIQPKLEKALASDRQLHAIDVVDRAGIALFSTDRGTIGEPLHARVAQAAEAGARGNRT